MSGAYLRRGTVFSHDKIPGITSPKMACGCPCDWVIDDLRKSRGLHSVSETETERQTDTEREEEGGGGGHTYAIVSSISGSAFFNVQLSVLSAPRSVQLCNATRTAS